jgi:hypothetical protein
MPTLTLDVAPFMPLIDPSTMQLLQSTRLNAPIAVVLNKDPSGPLPATYPNAVL